MVSKAAAAEASASLPPRNQEVSHLFSRHFWPIVAVVAVYAYLDCWANLVMAEGRADSMMRGQESRFSTIHQLRPGLSARHLIGQQCAESMRFSRLTIPSRSDLIIRSITPKTLTNKPTTISSFCVSLSRPMSAKNTLQSKFAALNFVSPKCGSGDLSSSSKIGKRTRSKTGIVESACERSCGASAGERRSRWRYVMAR